MNRRALIVLAVGLCPVMSIPAQTKAPHAKPPLSAEADRDTDSQETVSLDPITVVPSINPLDEELFRLRRMLEASTPCMGCDQASRPPRDSAIEGILKYVLAPAVPVEPTEIEKTNAAVRCAQSGPEMDFLC